MKRKTKQQHISAALDTLELDNPSEHRNKSWHDLFLAILFNETCHEALSYSYSKLINTQLPDVAITTAVSRGKP